MWVLPIPLALLWKRFQECSKEREAANVEVHINSEVVIRNDTNDPENKIYIFVAGIPVMRIEQVDKNTENFFANIKRMYRNKLNRQPIIKGK